MWFHCPHNNLSKSVIYNDVLQGLKLQEGDWDCFESQDFSGLGIRGQKQALSLCLDNELSKNLGFWKCTTTGHIT